jgi:hypothetical protein
LEIELPVAHALRARGRGGKHCKNGRGEEESSANGHTRPQEVLPRTHIMNESLDERLSIRSLHGTSLTAGCDNHQIEYNTAILAHLSGV